MDHVVGGKFKLGKKIGSGSFGELFLGQFAAGPKILLFLSYVIYFWEQGEEDADFAALLACSCECADRRGSRRQIGIGFLPSHYVPRVFA